MTDPYRTLPPSRPLIERVADTLSARPEIKVRARDGGLVVTFVDGCPHTLSCGEQTLTIDGVEIEIFD